MALFFSESLFNISFLISEFSQGAGLFRTFITLFGACLLRTLRKLFFPNEPCASLTLTELASWMDGWMDGWNIDPSEI